MNEIIFECETITPMFLAGADGQTPELRPPSIKGALRFWWRAMNGHLSLDDQKDRNGKIKKGLRTIESEIFGSADAKKGGRSKVIIQVMKGIKWDGTKTTPVPHKQRGWVIPAFREGNQFEVRLSMVNEEIKDGNTVIFSFEELKKLFILVSTLGGLGKRVRRGFGSFQITNRDIEMPTTIQDIYSLLNENLFRILQGKIYSGFRKNNPYPYIKEIEIGGADVNLMRRIGNATHEVKKIDPRGYDVSLGHATRGRFASPVYVSVIKYKGLRPIITTLNTAVEDKWKKADKRLQDEFKKRII